MKKLLQSCGVLLCLFFIIYYNGNQYSSSPDSKSALMQPEYIQAYSDFLLNASIDEGHDFPVRGYYLFDLNFDSIPELGVFHDSGGSMGGYFAYYCFDGETIVPIVDSTNQHVQTSNYTQIMADLEHKKVYFFKEMYLLQGNTNGTYGYVREIIQKDNMPYVYNILSLQVNQESNLEAHYHKDYRCEDDFLSDPELDDCLITKLYSEGKWTEISSAEYLRLKMEMLPADNSFVDLRDADISVFAQEPIIDDNYEYVEMKITAEEIETLFSKWLIYSSLYGVAQ